MIIQVTNLNSSTVERFDYDTATETLMVKFKSSKKQYVYKKVDRRTFGNVFHQAIDGGSVGGAIQFVKQHHDCEIEEDFLP